MALYLDSSAIVKLVVSEAESVALRAYLDAHEDSWTTSALARTEVVRAVSIAGIESVGRARTLLGRVTDIALTRDILDRAAELSPAPLRTLDAIHLASAIRLGHELSVLITYDRRMALAANDLGIPVQAPV